ncbi:peptidase S59 domain-containing protein, partial [Haematococcus lacustris]
MGGHTWPGEVFCYSDSDKPAVGQGLNCEAEVTLLNVYKMDRATQQPSQDPGVLVQWEKRLRQMCAKMGAQFVSYRPDTGAWRFRVEHFSRYGLLDDDDDDAEFEDAEFEDA